MVTVLDWNGGNPSPNSCSAIKQCRLLQPRLPLQDCCDDKTEEERTTYISPRTYFGKGRRIFKKWHILLQVCKLVGGIFQLTYSHQASDTGWFMCKLLPLVIFRSTCGGAFTIYYILHCMMLRTLWVCFMCFILCSFVDSVFRNLPFKQLHLWQLKSSAKDWA